MNLAGDDQAANGPSRWPPDLVVQKKKNCHAIDHAIVTALPNPTDANANANGHRRWRLQVLLASPSLSAPEEESKGGGWGAMGPGGGRGRGGLHVVKFLEVEPG